VRPRLRIALALSVAHEQRCALHYTHRQYWCRAKKRRSRQQYQ